MKIIAHRGDSANHPENTPASWAGANAAGADAIEADVRFLADGTGICTHDPTLERLFARPERADALTLDQLRELEKEDSGIGLLVDVLSNVVAGRAVVLDLKDESPRALDLVWKYIETNVLEALRHLVIVACHSKETAMFFGAKHQITVLGFMPNRNDGAAFHETGATIIRLWESDVCPRRVAKLKALGAEVWVTTGAGATGRQTGDTDDVSLRFLSDAGIDGVLVNDVLFAKAILEGCT